MIEDYKSIIDFGSNKITVMIGEYDYQTRELNIRGYNETKSDGVKNGVVVNIEAASNALIKAVEAAEHMAGREIKNATIAIAGAHINSIESDGVQGVEYPEREITLHDISRVLESAKAIKMNPGSDLLNILAKEYVLDGQSGIKDPLNMSGVRLEVKVHIITGAEKSIHNLIRSVNSSGISVDNYIFSGLAAAQAVLTDEEKELGVLLIDIGAGTIDAIAYENSSVFYTASYDKGGDDINLAISRNFRTPLNESERIKTKYGCAIAEYCNPNDEIDIQLVGALKNSNVKKIEISQVIEEALTKMFESMAGDIKKNDLVNKCVCGIVLTGGLAELKGVDELIERVTGLPARIGKSLNITGVTNTIKGPRNATGVGLLRYSFDNDDLKHLTQQSNSVFGVVGWFKDMIGQIF